MQRRKKYPFLLLFWILGWVSVTKVILTRKSIHRYLMWVLHGMEALMRKWRPKKVIKPEHFYARFHKEWEDVGKCGRTEYEPSAISWGNSNAWLLAFPHLTLSQRHQYSYLQTSKSTSLMKVLLSASEEKELRLRESLLAPAISQISSA